MRVRIGKTKDMSLHIRGYPACRIQKGLVLAHRDKDLSEEGIGFGVPVLRRGYETIFPGYGRINTEKNGDVAVITVDYDLNLVERMAAKSSKIGSTSFYKIKEYLSWLHREYPILRGILTSGSNVLRGAFGIEAGFEEVASAGVVNVVYTIREGTVQVSVDTGNLKECAEVTIMNEQGANYFDTYLDSDGVFLRQNAIGTWDETSADEASFIDSRDNVAFTLSKVRGARMFRGRERVANRLAWSGLAYALPRFTENFAYSIRIT